MSCLLYLTLLGKQMPLISIVLPTFNGEQYIAKSIQSCLDQSYKDFELIIINDCSTDNTINIISEYAKKDSRIKIIHNDINLKLPVCLNLGFTNAKGQYYTWTSDDNYYAPDALEKMLFELENNEDVDIVYSAYQFIDEKDSRLDLYGNTPEYLLFNCIVGACFLYKKNVHEITGGYDTTKFRMEDMDFWLRCACQFKFKYIDFNLYSYRKHRASLSTEIYKDKTITREYEINYQNSFALFFKSAFNLDLTEKEIKIHVDLFFEKVRQSTDDFNIGDELILYLEYLEYLKTLNWKKINFDHSTVIRVINEKRNRIIRLLINNLILKNKILENKKPSLAKHLNKPVFWYYKEYEVLPGWYKKIGHIIKAFQGNRSWRSLISKEDRQ